MEVKIFETIKNILGNQDDSTLIFSYSDRYSVFDWGEMPDKIPNELSKQHPVKYHVKTQVSRNNQIPSEIPRVMPGGKPEFPI